MALIIVIVITFDVSEKMDDFLGRQAPLKEIVVDYYLNFIPGFVNLYSPLFIFISVIFFTSKMAGNTELIAILGSGISYRRMLRPYLVGSIFISLIVLVLGMWIIPISNQTLAEFEGKYLKTRHEKFFNNIHFQPAPGVQVYASNFSIDNLNASQFRRDTYNDNRELIERMSADDIIYDTTNGTWQCFNLCTRTINGTSEKLSFEYSTKKDLGVVPADFNQKAIKIETLNSTDLWHYIQREKLRGSKNVIEAEIEFYQRLLNPIAIIIMTVIGVAVSSKKSRGGIGLHLAIGITLAFAFVVFMKISIVFATNGNLPPILAVLMPQFIFGIAAVLLVWKAPK